MSKRILSILLVLLTISFSALGAVSTPDQAQFINQNLLSPYNPGAENGKQYWSASGGTFTTTSTTANVRNGKFAFSWTPSGSGQTLSSTAVSAPSGGGNGLAQCWVNTANTDVVMSVKDGSNNVLNSATVPGGSAYQLVQLNFLHPSSGTEKIVFTSASGTSVAYIDSCFLGDAANLTNVSQMQKVGSVSISGCSSFWGGITSTTYADFGATAGCTYTVDGQAQAPGSVIPGISFSSLPPGDYRIEVVGNLNEQVSGAVSWWNIWDGTNAAKEEGQSFSGGNAIVVPMMVGTVSYTSAQSNVTFKVRSKVSSGGESRIYATAANSPFTISVYRYPNNAQQAITPNTTPLLWQGTLTNCTGTNTISSGGLSTFVDWPAQNCTVTDIVNRNIGTVSNYGSAYGITWTPKIAGVYEICSTHTQADNSSYYGTRIIDGAGTVISTLPQIISPSQFTGTSQCGLYNVANVGSAINIKVQTSCSGTCTLTQLSSQFSIKNVSQSLPMPEIVGMAAPSTWNGYISGCSTAPNLTGTSITDYSGGTTGCSVTQVASQNFPSVTLGSTNTSITFTPSKSGRFKVVANLPEVTTNTGNQLVAYLTDGSNNILDVAVSPYNNLGSDGQVTMPGAYIDVTAGTAVTLKIRGRITGGGGATGTIVDNFGAGFVRFQLIDVSQGVTLPVSGNVFSGAASQERVERARITNNGSVCTVASQSGSWISSASRTGVGSCQLTITGFSAAPVCTASSETWSVQMSSTTATQVNTATFNNVGTNIDTAYHIICMGPK